MFLSSQQEHMVEIARNKMAAIIPCVETLIFHAVKI